MFNATVPTMTTFAARRRLEGRFDPKKLGDEPDKILGTLRELVATHEKADERHMMWLAERMEAACLARYVECEAEITHYVANAYDVEATKQRAELAKIEEQWRICVTLSHYFRTIHIHNSARGVAEFLKAAHPKPKKAGK